MDIREALTGVILKVSVQGQQYSIELKELTKEKYDAVLAQLGVGPLHLVSGKEPEIDIKFAKVSTQQSEVRVIEGESK